MSVNSLAQSLSERQLHLATCAALEAQGDLKRLEPAVRDALDAGITINELKEALSQLYAYTGFPRSLNALGVLSKVLEEGNELWKEGKPWMRPSVWDDAEAALKLGTEVQIMLTVDSYLNPIVPVNLPSAKESVLPLSSVTFEPGCRNNWHIHHGARQMLICVSGRGWYQEWGKPAIALKAGDVVDIPEGVKHWHGAQKDSWFQHLATHIKVENTYPESEPNEWLEPVSDEEYNKL